MNTKDILQFYLDSGVDASIHDQPVDKSAPLPTTQTEAVAVPKAPSRAVKPIPAKEPAAALLNANSFDNLKPKSPIPNPQPPISNQAPPSLEKWISATRNAADKANTLEELRAAIIAFEGCALKKTATNTVFSDGNPQAKVMVIGEAPGAQEDEQGIPFCGASGKLLDKVIGSIGLTREKNAYISNTIFWRPPGNRTPTKEEIAICQPFVEKHIALINPQVLLLSGGTAVYSLLGSELSISRMRGKIYEYSNRYLASPVKTAVTYHPSYLLRSPGQKKLAWQDMMFLEESLR